MKTGKTIQELTQELSRQRELMVDFLAETTAMEFLPDASLLMNGDDGAFTKDVNRHAHTQFCGQIPMPWQYYEYLLRNDRSLLAVNANRWLQGDDRPKKQRLIRTLDGVVRANLSNRYLRIDNYDVAAMVLGLVAESPQYQLVSSDVTERHLYMKFIDSTRALDISVGDTVQTGFAIQNSEIGLGMLRVDHLIYRLVCANGLIIPNHATTYRHSGRSLQTEKGAIAISFSQETEKARDRLILSELKDVIRSVTSQGTFEATVQRLRETKENKIEGAPSGAVRVLSKQLRFTEREQESIMEHFMAGGTFTQWSLLNAVTRTAQDQKYDRATELEQAGAKVLALKPREWRAIATASHGDN